MAYAEVTVVVDGAEEEHTIIDNAAFFTLEEYIEEVGQEATEHGLPTQAYVTYHDHDFYIYVDGEPADCECAQYETDHRPYREWNTE